MAVLRLQYLAKIDAGLFLQTVMGTASDCDLQSEGVETAQTTDIFLPNREAGRDYALSSPQVDQPEFGDGD